MYKDLSTHSTLKLIAVVQGLEDCSTVLPVERIVEWERGRGGGWRGGGLTGRETGEGGKMCDSMYSPCSALAVSDNQGLFLLHFPSCISIPITFPSPLPPRLPNTPTSHLWGLFQQQHLLQQPEGRLHRLAGGNQVEAAMHEGLRGEDGTNIRTTQRSMTWGGNTRRCPCVEGVVRWQGSA